MRTRVASGRLVAETVRVNKLPEETRDAMWTLFAGFYEGTTPAIFARDLSSKDHVILLRDEGDRSLRGFSTVQAYRRQLQGRAVVAVFTGDTVLEPAYWGQPALPIAFFRYLMVTKLRASSTPVYWFLVSKGYRTYLTLSRNLPRYWPRHDAPTPPFEQSLIELLATDKFGAAYLPEFGILRFKEPAGQLKPDVAPVSPELLAQPDVRYFVERNPQHALGEELCCLGLVDLGLPVSFLYKHLRRALERQWKRLRRRWASASASS